MFQILAHTPIHTYTDTHTLSLSRVSVWLNVSPIPPQPFASSKLPGSNTTCCPPHPPPHFKKKMAAVPPFTQVALTGWKFRFGERHDADVWTDGPNRCSQHTPSMLLEGEEKRRRGEKKNGEEEKKREEKRREEKRREETRRKEKRRESAC